MSLRLLYGISHLSTVSCPSPFQTLDTVPAVTRWSFLDVCLLQGYRPSHVPQELIEQIAVVVEAKAFLHVVSQLASQHLSDPQQSVS
jgi:hypothetical protein